jgi:ABC-type transporter Mla subunit MlaD
MGKLHKLRRNLVELQDLLAELGRDLETALGGAAGTRENAKKILKKIDRAQKTLAEFVAGVEGDLERLVRAWSPRRTSGS